MNNVMSMIRPYQEEVLGFRCFSRGIGRVHKALFGALDETILSDEDASVWLSQLMCEKIKLLVFLGPGKGNLELRPWDSESNSVDLATEGGLMVVVRVGMLSCQFFN